MDFYLHLQNNKNFAFSAMSTSYSQGQLLVINSLRGCLVIANKVTSSHAIKMIPLENSTEFQCLHEIFFFLFYPDLENKFCFPTRMVMKETLTFENYKFTSFIYHRYCIFDDKKLIYSDFLIFTSKLSFWLYNLQNNGLQLNKTLPVSLIFSLYNVFKSVVF